MAIINTLFIFTCIGATCVFYAIKGKRAEEKIANPLAYFGLGLMTLSTLLAILIIVTL